MQPEEAVERQHAAGDARCAQRRLAAQAGVVRITVRRHGRQTIQGAAQDHEHEARVARADVAEGEAGW